MAGVTALTVGALLHSATDRLRASGSESARLDAEVLLGHVLGIDRTGVLAHPDAPVGTGQATSFDAAVARRELGEPVAYIRGFKEFRGLAFFVDSRVLIPRPETETLVDLALERVRDVLTASPRPPGAPPMRIWDVGTGSGAIAVSLAVTLRGRGYAGTFRVLATDASADALAVAVENAVGHGVADAMDFGVGDLFVVDGPAGAVTDLVVANLPYIPTDDVGKLPVAASFEPRAALDGGPDGLDAIRRLMAGLPGVLSPDGMALLEIGGDQADAVLEAAGTLLPGWTAEVLPDLGGSPRVARLARGGSGSASGSDSLSAASRR